MRALHSQSCVHTFQSWFQVIRFFEFSLSHSLFNPVLLVFVFLLRLFLIAQNVFHNFFLLLFCRPSFCRRNWRTLLCGRCGFCFSGAFETDGYGAEVKRKTALVLSRWHVAKWFGNKTAFEPVAFEKEQDLHRNGLSIGTPPIHRLVSVTMETTFFSLFEGFSFLAFHRPRCLKGKHKHPLVKYFSVSCYFRAGRVCLTVLSVFFLQTVWLKSLTRKREREREREGRRRNRIDKDTILQWICEHAIAPLHLYFFSERLFKCFFTLSVAELCRTTIVKTRCCQQTEEHFHIVFVY